jgi:hypothetical protein
MHYLITPSRSDWDRFVQQEAVVLEPWHSRQLGDFLDGKKARPELAKASRLLGLDGIVHCWEEPQTVRYRRNGRFTWHVDTLGPDESKMDLGGQRTVTLILYLTDWQENKGVATIFRDLGGNSQW